MLLWCMQLLNVPHAANFPSTVAKVSADSLFMFAYQEIDTPAAAAANVCPTHLQGDIEKVASRSPEQLTQLFEQISGSDALAKDYSEASAAKEKAEAAAGLLFAKKKAVAAERKQKKEQKEEAERHMAALEEQVRRWLYAGCCA
jgi:hypothetical protein